MRTLYELMDVCGEYGDLVEKAVDIAQQLGGPFLNERTTRLSIGTENAMLTWAEPYETVDGPGLPTECYYSFPARLLLMEGDELAANIKHEAHAIISRQKLADDEAAFMMRIGR